MVILLDNNPRYFSLMIMKLNVYVYSNVPSIEVYKICSSISNVKTHIIK